jgi:hypothetical protein
MSEAVKHILLARLMYCQDRMKYCHAGGLQQLPQHLHFNYGLPCVGGTITYQDGTETISTSCIFCGSTGQ